MHRARSARCCTAQRVASQCGTTRVTTPDNTSHHSPAGRNAARHIAKQHQRVASHRSRQQRSAPRRSAHCLTGCARAFPRAYEKALDELVLPAERVGPVDEPVRVGRVDLVMHAYSLTKAYCLLTHAWPWVGSISIGPWVASASPSAGFVAAYDPPLRVQHFFHEAEAARDPVCACVRACACVCVRVRACVRACVRA